MSSKGERPGKGRESFRRSTRTRDGMLAWIVATRIEEEPKKRESGTVY